MTREQAIEKVRDVVNRGGAIGTHGPTFVDSLIALDILKVEEPKTAKQIAMDIADDYVTSIRALHEMFRNFDLAGLKITKADK